MKICVLLGGASPERMVSIDTAGAIGNALKELGHEIRYCDPALPWAKRYDVEKMIRENDISAADFKKTAELNDKAFADYIRWMKHKKFDLIFNATHGGNGENGVFSAHFELAGLPFTGPGSAAASLAMDKYRSKTLFEGAGIPTADFEMCRVPRNAPEKIDFPLVIKPSGTGSSVGLHVIKKEKNIFEESSDALFYDKEILIEEYIEGRELTVAVVAGEPYPVVEIVPEGGIYDYKRKYGKGKSKYIVPAEISKKNADWVQELALRVYDLLGLENYARIDFRMDKKEKLFCLEANTLPGMTSTSLMPKSSRSAGIDFPELLEIIIEDALKIRS